MTSSTTEQTLNNGTFCNLQVSIWTASKKMPTGEVHLGDTDDTLFRVNKDLIAKQVLKPIRQQAQKANEILHNRALPFNIRGVYYIPTANIQSALDSIEGYKARFWEKVNEFCNQYEVYREEARLRLNGHFKESDYPEPDKIRDKFGWEMQMMQFAAPSRLQFVSPEMYQRAMVDFHARIEEFRENSVGLLREKFRELVQHMQERLTPGADGQRKIFRDSMVSNLREFIADFQSLNITNDTDLGEQVRRVGQLMEGVEPQQLRDSTAFPTLISNVLVRVRERVDQMIVNAPKRRVRYQHQESAQDQGVAA